jgi:hypothetical protein
MTSKLALVIQPQDYFRELVSEAILRQRVVISQESEFYLVNLLNDFMVTDRLYVQDEDGIRKNEPLALMLKEALEQPHLEGQKRGFRKVGDVSLYIGGFFQASLAKKVVDIDYYIGMGESAYQNVSIRQEESPMRVLYEELAQKFAKLIEILAEIGEKAYPKSEKDLLRLYDVWIKTHSERAARSLQEAGIIPNQNLKKNWQ